MVPQAYGEPAERRATRDLLRRRLPLTRQRAAWLVHGQQTTSQSNLPESGKKLASKAHRNGVAERFPAPAVQTSVAVDRTLFDSYAALRSALAWTLLQTAKQPNAQTLSRLPSVPGIGQIVRLVWLDEMHAITRFPRVQDFVSYGRLGTCAKEAAGQRYGTSGAKLGKAELQWAFAEAAVLFLRNNPAGQPYLARLEHNHGKGKAFTIVAHT
jgi:transposase